MGGLWPGQGEAQPAVKGGGPVIAALDMQRQGLALPLRLVLQRPQDTGSDPSPLKSRQQRNIDQMQRWPRQVDIKPARRFPPLLQQQEPGLGVAAGIIQMLRC